MPSEKASKASKSKTLTSVKTTATGDTGATLVNAGGPTTSAAPHTLSSRRVADELETSGDNGLSFSAAKKLHEQYGDNILNPPPRPSPYKLLGRQILNAMTLVLLAAMAVSFGTQDWIEAGVIAALVILNVSVGFSQEWKAEKTVAALASVGAPVAIVLRHEKKSQGGKEIQIKVEEVVPGDIILLSPGSIVPADARVLEVSQLEADEALLTGESLPVSKQVEQLEKADIPLGDRVNMVYAGSQVSKGRGKAIVVGTGMNTELGKIASAIERKVKSKETGWKAKWHKIQVALGVKGTTPLQMKLNKIAYLLLAIAILLAIIVVASTGFFDIDDSIATYAVATAVSILPASLVAVVSLTLATASRELAKRNALVRRMDAIEGLAIVTDINSDKTGTLTVGKMVMKKAWIPAPRFQQEGERELDTSTGQTYEIETGSDPYYPRGVIRAIDNDKRLDLNAEIEDSDDDESGSESDHEDNGTGEDIVTSSTMEQNLANMVLCASLCNMATIHRSKDGPWQANGDATEIALQVFAHKFGQGKPHLTRPRHTGGGRRASIQSIQRTDTRHSENIPEVHLDGHYDLVVEHPFDSSIKRMSTGWTFVSEEGKPKECKVFLKGAVERVLDRCSFIGMGNHRVPLTAEHKEEIIERMDSLASEGLRVLALSGKDVAEPPATVAATEREEFEKDMGFLGLAGIYDPPRPQSRGAVLEAAQAGITTRMLTGDHPATATAIAKAVGIIGNDYAPSSIMTGQQFDALTEDQIDALPDLPLVIARCAPETKVRMVEALHRRKIHGMKRFCIMTGDGVNDSPALKRADVGVAMGLNGSDVAKSCSDIVLADDNFATITRAIRKGRATFSNLSKFLLYLLSGNVAEVLVMLVGLAFKNEDGVSVYPMSPVAALWINTIAAGPPALALGLEPTAKDAMEKSPLAYKTIFTKWWFIDMLVYSVVIGGLTIANFVIVVWGRGNGDLGRDCNDGSFNETCDLLYHGRGTTFATLTLMLMLHSLQCKHLELGLFQVDLLDNKLLLWSAFALSLSVFPVLYIPRISDYAFQVLGLTWEWGIIFGMLFVYLAITELYKLTRRKFTKNMDAGGPKVTEKGLPRFDTMAVRDV